MNKLLAVVALLACASLKATVQTPALAPVDTQTMQVTFTGTPYDPERNYVCGTVGGADGGSFSCVDYGYFQTQLAGGQ